MNYPNDQRMDQQMNHFTNCVATSLSTRSRSSKTQEPVQGNFTKSSTIDILSISLPKGDGYVKGISGKILVLKLRVHDTSERIKITIKLIIYKITIKVPNNINFLHSEDRLLT